MKIAVYTIALNEALFADRWAQSAAEADYRVVADTGSTDDTVDKLRAAGVDVLGIDIKPWRFDQARNASLALLPMDADICISLDMDEVLMPGWRQALEDAWQPGTTRLRYHYVWTWHENGTPKTHFFGEKIHARHAYAWKYPAHEVLVPLPGIVEKIALSDSVRIHHHPDKTKPRSQYLDLMALATREDPSDDRCAYYYGRELISQRKFREAIAELQRHLSLPRATWNLERSASWRHIAYCHKRLGAFREARSALLHACAEAPETREPWHDFGRLCMEQKDWSGGVWAAHRALAITEMPQGHTRDAVAWSVGPYDTGSVCAYYDGQHDLARTWLTKALELEPENPRLLKNGRWIFKQA